MQIDFEKWILSQKVGEIAKGLFIEAATCYKISAYRAALLLSYLGFQTILRDRILVAKNPSSIISGQWQDIRNNLLNDDKWDVQVFETTQMGLPRSVFKLSDDLRNQVQYWKNRRNDCAHAKANEITNAHVEAFWAFTRSNLAKFVVDGSKDGLLSEIKIHFDRSLTPAGADPAPIISRIPTSLDNSQISSFLEEIGTIVKDVPSQPQGSEDIIRFFNGLFTNDDAITKHLVAFLTPKFGLLIPLFRMHSDKLQYFADNPKLIRKLWYEKLFRTFGVNDMLIYCALLRNNLIPNSELKEAHQTVILCGPPAPTSEEMFQVLKNSGFFELLRNFAFDQHNIGQFDWANKSVEIVTYYLGKFEIDKEIANRLSSTFNSKTHPYSLKSGINRLFHENPSKRAECLQVMEINNLSIPEYLNLKPVASHDEDLE